VRKKDGGTDEDDTDDETEESEDDTSCSSSSESSDEASSSTNSDASEDESSDGDTSYLHHHHHHAERKKKKEKEKKKKKKKKSKRSLSAEGKRTRRVLRKHWGTVSDHDPLGELMDSEKRKKIVKSLKEVEPFYRKLENFETTLHSSTRTIREADSRLQKDLTEMRVLYDKEMDLLNDVVNYKWEHARSGCLQLLDLTIDRLTTTNLERYSYRGARSVSDAFKTGHTEPTTRPSYEKFE
jgi:hypothetical protein